jgi:hypothetical protein
MRMAETNFKGCNPIFFVTDVARIFLPIFGLDATSVASAYLLFIYKGTKNFRGCKTHSANYHQFTFLNSEKTRSQ